MSGLPPQKPSRRTLGRFLRKTVRDFDAQMGTIHMLDPRDGMLHLTALVGDISPPVRAAIETIPIGKGIAGEAALRREPVSICNIQRDESGVTRPAAKTIGTQGALCVPILRGEQLLGALGIGSNRERTFSEQETRRLLDVAASLATELSKAQRAKPTARRP